MKDSPRKRAVAWLPVRSLGARHRRRLVAHLKALPARDRYLRFGYEASDEQIERYVETIDFEHDEAFGVFNRRLDLVATAHLAFGPRSPTSDDASTAEFGVSVLP
jgi:hypothetical protein